MAAIRLAGRKSLSLLKKHFTPSQPGKAGWRPFQMRTGWFHDGHNAPLDEVMAVYMPAGRSYTGLAQVEVYCHGGSEVVKLLLDNFLASGAQAAEPGEFTRLAFLSGRIDLTKAEAVAEIIAANTETSVSVAREHLTGAYSEHIALLRDQLIAILAEIEAGVDYPEEDIAPDDAAGNTKALAELAASIDRLRKSYGSGRILREGFKIVIGGRPNAGKSSLFNLLLKKQRALVAPSPGTTRDYLSEWIELDGLPVNIIDTAGLRLHSGQVEKAGQEVARRFVSRCDLLLWLVDLSRRRYHSEAKDDLARLDVGQYMLVGNKIDLLRKTSGQPGAKQDEMARVSCLTRKGISRLVRRVTERVHELLPDLTSGLVVTSARHRRKLQKAVTSIRKANRLLKSGHFPELVVFELRQATAALDEITGRIYNEEILDKIFSKFCIGK